MLCIVRRLADRVKTDNLLTARRPASFQMMVRRDKIHVRRMNFICRRKTHLFDTNDPNSFYFIIESRDGTELARSPNVPPIPPVRIIHSNASLNSVNTIAPQLPDFSKPAKIVNYENYRETATRCHREK